MGVSVGLAAFKLSTQLCPIILNNGIAANIPGGGMLPIIAITEALNFLDGILSGGSNIGLDDFFANYQVLPGDTIVDQQIGHYPFANQAVAANAVIAQPLRVSLLMICPVRQSFGYAVKLATMMALKEALAKHNASGGTYTVITPSTFYPNCVLLRLEDVTNGESKQLQNAYRWDFEQPLLTQQQASLAEQALNATMSKNAVGVQNDGSLFGLAQSINSPFAAQTGALIPSASGAVGAMTNIAPSLDY